MNTGKYTWLGAYGKDMLLLKFTKTIILFLERDFEDNAEDVAEPATGSDLPKTREKTPESTLCAEIQVLPFFLFVWHTRLMLVPIQGLVQTHFLTEVHGYYSKLNEIINNIN